MIAAAIILANTEFVSAFFLKLKIHETEMANYVTFMYCCFVKKIFESQSTILWRIECWEFKKKKFKIGQEIRPVNDYEQ